MLSFINFPNDLNIIHTDTLKSHANIKFGVEKILASKAIPIIMGGDHSINIPCILLLDM